MEIYNFDRNTGLNKYDSYIELLNDYLNLLYFALNSGLCYNTNKNSRLAKVVLKEGKLINYVQTKMGEWDYTKSRFQREVSMDFVLYLFNKTSLFGSMLTMSNLSVTKSHLGIQDTTKKIDFESIISENSFIAYQKHIESYSGNGYISNFTYQEREENALLYNIILKIMEYTKHIKNEINIINKGKNLSLLLQSGELKLSQLSENDKQIYEYVINYDKVANPNLNPSLENFCDNINWVSEKQLKYKCNNTDDPINITSIINPYTGKSESTIIIDYANSKEFIEPNKKIIKLH